ncbi:MAG TPA: lysine--tRNA ligase [Thermodesulfovibrionia bacterium]|nr:lysine--tRNA ligase [Thermodesulfovibrionia bacterium]
MEEINELMQERIKKLKQLRDMGIDPYGGVFEVKDRVSDILEKYEDISKEELETKNENYTIAGRIIALRSFGKAAFAHVQDASGKLQIYFKKDVLGKDYDVLKNLDVGDIIGLKGPLFRTKTNELTIEVMEFVLLCKSLRPLPEKWHGLRDVETRYRQRYVDLIVNPHVREIFLKRSRLIKAIRIFFDERDFIEVETPMMHQIPGGATARPFKTRHIALGMDLYLRIAPELYLKKLLVGGYEKVYELNKNFRNEGISTKHNPEFTMLEFYIAYADYKYLMDFTEALIAHLCREVAGGLRIPYSESSASHDAGAAQSQEQIIDFTPPWPRLSMKDAMEQQGVDSAVFSDIEKAREYAIQNNIDISRKATYGKILDEIFKKKVEPKLIQPVFIVDYPVELSPLAKRKKDNPEFVERFELFVAGREIANAFSELNDPVDQKERFLKQVEARNMGDEEAGYMDEDFVRALEYGMPPAAGEGIGIDRLFMIFTNSPSIRDVVLFPQLKPEQ